MRSGKIPVSSGLCKCIHGNGWISGILARTILPLSIFYLVPAISNAQSGGKESLSLDGRWEIIFDHHNRERAGGWHFNKNFGQSESIRYIDVPSCWETTEEDYEGLAFYRHKFWVPDQWEDKVIRLQFGAVNYLAEVWLNDEVVGFHEGGFTPFEFRVDEMVRPGDTNVLILRVVSPILRSDKIIDGTGRLEIPSWRGGITGGIWQSVRIIETGPAYFQDVFIQPDIHENQAIFEIEVDQTGASGVSSRLEILVTQTGKDREPIPLKESWQLRPGINRRTYAIEIPDAVYWSPDHPLLYTASLRILTGEGISDEWSTNFGMRELTIREKDFNLNGEPIFIKAAFFEGLYPNRIAYPDSEEMVREEMRLAREAGFNTIRPWRHPVPPMWLDIADEMGIMVVGSPALECMQLPLSTPYIPSRVENEITQAILRDRNRACIVQWELFNELHRPVLKQMMRPMALRARELDPTRLILDESGGWACGANMYLPHETEPVKFNDIHTYPGPFIGKNLYDGFLAIGLTDEEKKDRGLSGRAPGRNVVPGLMSFISELGYGSLPDLELNNELFAASGNPLTPAFRYHKRLAVEQERMLEESGFRDLYPEMSRFYLDQQWIHGEANKRMIEAARSNPGINGYCIHALTDGDWILGAGLLDLWRNPKSHAYRATKTANQPQILAVRILPRNVYAGAEIGIEVTGINELGPASGVLEIEIIDGRSQRILDKRVGALMEQGVTSLFQEMIHTGKWEGHYSVKARFSSQDKSAVAENSAGFDVFAPCESAVPDIRVAVLDPDETLTGFLSKVGVRYGMFGEGSDPPGLLLVSGYHTADNYRDVRLEHVLDYVREGGTAIFLEELPPKMLEEGSLLPFRAISQRARGLWTCIPHLVRDHPIFSGLPSGKMMDEVYENVWAQNTLRNLGEDGMTVCEPIVVSVGFEWFSADHKFHYSGPGQSWWGSDLALLELGKGHVIFSQLRLLEHLGIDPVADRILCNMIRYGSGL